MPELLDLPEEVLLTISAMVLTTSDGTIHIREEQGHLRIAHCRSIPSATREAGMHEGDIRALPRPWNALQYASKRFFNLTRGLELKLNHLKVHGNTFDTFRRLDQLLPTPSWFFAGTQWLEKVRKVTIGGNYGVKSEADENVLHGILRFGRDHPKAIMQASVTGLHLQGNISSFLSFAYLIREAVRGVPRPAVVAPDNKTVVQKWRRRKTVAVMDVSNVRFIPADACDPDRIRRVVYGKEGKKGKGKGRGKGKTTKKSKRGKVFEAAIKDFGSEAALEAVIKGWYTTGI